ncbi:glycine dehydrogenase (decarboxylating), mitochondrial [Acrasis kona]|uniref:Glycine dehydrogenase (Decarboxylating), mitochondrial n=1 Tax=Acrasis kona TaxID=1008807 RepID=A0AAW2ZEN1_9EUKA
MTLTSFIKTGSTKEPTKEEIWNALRREMDRRIEAEKEVARLQTHNAVLQNRDLRGRKRKK